VSEECTCYNACCHWLPLDGKGVEIWSTQIWDRERTLEESQYNNQKNTPTQAALLPSLLKTILTVQLTNQLQNIILHGTYLNNHTWTSFKNFWIHKHFKDEADFLSLKFGLNPSWVDCAKYLAVSTCQFCFFVEPSVLKISQNILESSPI
jgi:hypothetical protein